MPIVRDYKDEDYNFAQLKSKIDMMWDLINYEMYKNWWNDPNYYIYLRLDNYYLRKWFVW